MEHGHRPVFERDEFYSSDSPPQSLGRDRQADLGRGDVDAIQGVVSILAEARSLERLRRDVVDVLPALVPSTLVSWNEVDVTEPNATFDLVLNPDLNSTIDDKRLSCLKRAFAAHIAEHPVIRYFERTGDGRPRTISDFLSEKAFHETPLYQTFYSQAELATEDQLSFILPQPELVVGIALNRPRRDFTGRDRAILNVLRPQIVQAHRNASAFDRLGRLVSSLEEALESDDEGLVLLTAWGRIDQMTRLAHDLLARFFDVGDIDGRLPDELAAWVKRPADERAPQWPFVKVRHDHLLLVRRLPWPGGVALLLAERGTAGTSSALTRLGLTTRQAEVLSLVAEGCSTKQIAARLEISPRTVDKHIERSLRILGVESRLAAVNLIHQVEGQYQRMGG